VNTTCFQKFGKKRGERYASIVFGESRGSEDGVQFRAKGLLSATSELEFSRSLKKLEGDHPALHTWLVIFPNILLDGYLVLSPNRICSLWQYRRKNEVEQ
jgi:hypothetical protein